MKLIKAAYAANPIGTFQPPGGVINNEGEVGTFFTNVISVIIAISGIWFLIQLLLAGFSYITGAGDSKKTEMAMKKITDSFIGLIIIVISFAAVTIIGQLFFGNANFVTDPQIKTF